VFGTLIDMSKQFLARRSFVSVIVGALLLWVAATAFAFDIGSLLNTNFLDSKI
jgi:hypothetical protein